MEVNGCRQNESPNSWRKHTNNPNPVHQLMSWETNCSFNVQLTPKSILMLGKWGVTSQTINNHRYQTRSDDYPLTSPVLRGISHPFYFYWSGITDRCTCINTRSVLFAEKHSLRQQYTRNLALSCYFCCSNQIKIIWSCANTKSHSHTDAQTQSHRTHTSISTITDMHECNPQIHKNTNRETKTPQD